MTNVIRKMQETAGKTNLKRKVESRRWQGRKQRTEREKSRRKRTEERSKQQGMEPQSKNCAVKRETDEKSKDVE